eukprot:358374-Chlamydomonas_euryale.AAC.3
MEHGMQQEPLQPNTNASPGQATPWSQGLVEQVAHQSSQRLPWQQSRPHDACSPRRSARSTKRPMPHRRCRAAAAAAGRSPARRHTPPGAAASLHAAL